MKDPGFIRGAKRATLPQNYDCSCYSSAHKFSTCREQLLGANDLSLMPLDPSLLPSLYTFVFSILDVFHDEAWSLLPIYPLVESRNSYNLRLPMTHACHESLSPPHPMGRRVQASSMSVCQVPDTECIIRYGTVLYIHVCVYHHRIVFTDVPSALTLPAVINFFLSFRFVYFLILLHEGRRWLPLKERDAKWNPYHPPPTGDNKKVEEKMRAKKFLVSNFTLVDSIMNGRFLWLTQGI